MKLYRLLLATLLVGTLAVVGCNDDQTGTAGSGGSGTAGSGGDGTAGSGGGAPIPSEACGIVLCARDSELRALCEQEGQTCLDTEPEINRGECILGVQEARCDPI